MQHSSCKARSQARQSTAPQTAPCCGQVLHWSLRPSEISCAHWKPLSSHRGSCGISGTVAVTVSVTTELWSAAHPTQSWPAEQLTQLGKPFATGGAGPALWLGHAMKGPMAAGTWLQDGSCPRKAVWFLGCFQQIPHHIPRLGALSLPHSRLTTAAVPRPPHGSPVQARRPRCLSQPAPAAAEPPPPSSGAAAMQKEQPRRRLAQAQLPRRAGTGGGCRP